MPKLAFFVAAFLLAFAPLTLAQGVPTPPVPPGGPDTDECVQACHEDFDACLASGEDPAVCSDERNLCVQLCFVVALASPADTNEPVTASEPDRQQPIPQPKETQP